MGRRKNALKNKTKGAAKASATSSDMFTAIEKYLTPRSDRVFYILWVISILTGLILFDMRVSTGGDDSTYIHRAFDFLRVGTFPFEQGPLYPLMLSPFIKVFGINLFILKLMSFISINLAFLITYRTLKNRIPYLMLFLLLGFIALNPFYQYFSSVTYTEAFFLFLQSIAIYFSMILIDRSEEGRLNIRKDWWLLILIGLTYLLVSLTKTVAIICILPLLVWLLMNKKWDYLFGTFLAFLAIRIGYELCIRAAYGTPDMGQFQAMFLKDPYKPQFGYEDFGGMADRFIMNSNIYLSARFLSILYLRAYDDIQVDYIPPVTILIYFLLGYFLFLSYRKHKVVFFVALYTLALVAAVFFGIHATNAQYRLVIIIVPYLVLLLMFGFYHLSRNSFFLQVLFLGLFGYIICTSCSKVTKKFAQNYPILKENLKGNPYAGFTPDWVNYLKASAWAADSLPARAGILARKHSMSFIYGKGRAFVPLYKVPVIYDADSMIAFVKSTNCRYVIMASLRMNPAKNDGQIINTMQMIMGTIYEKYPDKFKLIHNEGTEETAEVYEMLF